MEEEEQEQEEEEEQEQEGANSGALMRVCCVRRSVQVYKLRCWCGFRVHDHNHHLLLHHLHHHHLHHHQGEPQGL